MQLSWAEQVRSSPRVGNGRQATAFCRRRYPLIPARVGRPDTPDSHAFDFSRHPRPSGETGLCSSGVSSFCMRFIPPCAGDGSRVGMVRPQTRHPRTCPENAFRSLNTVFCIQRCIRGTGFSAAVRMRQAGPWFPLPSAAAAASLPDAPSRHARITSRCRRCSCPGFTAPSAVSTASGNVRHAVFGLPSRRVLRLASGFLSAVPGGAAGLRVLRCRRRGSVCLPRKRGCRRGCTARSEGRPHASARRARTGFRPASRRAAR